MRNANGWGSVYKLPGKRRRPWIARKTVGYDDEGRQKYMAIGYYRTRQEAMLALAEFNNNPYDLEMSKTTFSQIYEMWLSETCNENTNRSTKKNYTTAYDHCKALHNMKMSDIRLHHMQTICDENNDSHYVVSRMIILFNKLFSYCMKHDCLKKNYAEGLENHAEKSTGAERQAFSSDEVRILWKNSDDNIYVKLVLMLIYSGVRINELLNLKKINVHLEEQYFDVVDSKTEAGIRTVPIADVVLPFWKSFYDKSNCEYVICTDAGQQLTYDNFKRRYWHPLMERLNMQHTIHETRHTCISLLVVSNVNQTIIKKIVGHKSIMNLTERVYTHIEIQELIENINKIKIADESMLKSTSP